MAQTLAALGRLLLQAVPTFLLVVLLYFYLKKIYFGPISRVLQERYDATEGARKLAEQSFAQAKEKAAQYEAALRQARAEIYREQEQFRAQLRQEQAEALQAARGSADTKVKEASAQLAAELAAAKDSLRLQSESLSDQIVDAILHRRPA